MKPLLTLDDYTQSCQHCDRARYTLTARGDVAHAEFCSHCFSSCPACAGEEFTFVTDEQGYSFVRNCSLCGSLKARIRAFNEAQIPARYHSIHATLESFQTHTPAVSSKSKAAAIGNLPKVKLQLYNWVRSFAPGDSGFLLYGEVGTGKTHLLAAVIRHLTLEKGIDARFVEFSHLLSEIREQFDQGRGESKILGPLSEIPVLAIDELGKGRNTEWQLSIIDEIISKRYNRGLTTLFTTNYPVELAATSGSEAGGAHFRQHVLRESLPERIGDRIFSRLHEMATFIAIQAPDFRKQRGTDQPAGVHADIRK